MTKAIVRDRFYVPLKAIDASTVRELLEVPWKTKSLCRPQCPLAMQQGAYCSTCPSKGAKVKLWEIKTTRAGRKMLAFPSGDESLLEQLVPNATVIDKRTNPKMRSALRWTGKLRDGSLNEKGKPTPNQKKMLGDWLRHTKVETGGLVISPPRSGKTVIGVSAAMATRSRTFITASKIDFLRQFGRRFGELTNLRQLYAAGKRPVVLIDPKGWKDGPACGVHVLKKWGPDVDAADVVMFCYQQMLDTEGGRARMHRYVDGKFGLGIADECITGDTPLVVGFNGETAAARDVANNPTHYRVLSRGEGGVHRLQHVSRVFKKRVSMLIEIKHEGGILKCTRNHPIWLENRQAWVPAEEVKEGDDVYAYPPRSGL